MGRPREAGRVVYLGRLRFRPGIDPPGLGEFLEAFEAAPLEQKGALLRAALIGGTQGWDGANAVEAPVEDAETAGLIDDLVGGF